MNQLWDHLRERLAEWIYPIRSAAASRAITSSPPDVMTLDGTAGTAATSTQVGTTASAHNRTGPKGASGTVMPAVHTQRGAR